MSAVYGSIGSMTIGGALALLAAVLFGLALGVLVGALWARVRAAGDERTAPELQRVAEHAVVREDLARLHDQIRDLEHQRASWQGQLSEQVAEVRTSAEELRRETRSLATALRKPQVRGRWGELHLRRAVELAGLVDRCDFTEQVHLAGTDRALRPDLVVRLAGNRQVVVDAKVPLEAFLDAAAASDDAERDRHLARHAGQLRRHVDLLAAKRYWQSLPGTPEFVVLFVPAEAFLSAALEADGSLLEYAAGRRVVLATPTTLIALLRTVAHGWTQDGLADRAQEIHELGRQLYERLVTLGSHLDQVGRSLNAAAGHYNAAVGSLEGRVLVSGRRLGELVVEEGDLAAPRQVERVARSLGAVELHPATGGQPGDAARRAAGE